MPELLDSIKTASMEAWEASKPCDVMFGTVVTSSPLKINVEQKMTLSTEQLILTRNVTDYTINMTVSHRTESATVSGGPPHSHSFPEMITGLPEYEEDSVLPEPPDSLNHKHKIEGGATGEYVPPTGEGHSHEYNGTKSFIVRNALKSGEKVVLLRKAGGQQFIVLDRY